MHRSIAVQHKAGMALASGLWNTDAKGTGGVTGIGLWSCMAVQALLAQRASSLEEEQVWGSNLVTQSSAERLTAWA
jgi:hypothetical protein